VPRDELADAIWGESPPATWEKALTVIASKLRGLLAEDGITLTNAFGCYRLELPEGTWVDLFAAAGSAEDAEEALVAGELDQARAAAESAESLARLTFLPGEGGTWVEQKRRDLADIRERALSVLADACLRSGAAREAARWSQELIALSPFSEAGYRRLMEAHAAAGNRAEALRVYEHCRRLLAEELGAYPSPETEAIYRRLLETPTVHGEAQAASEAPPIAAASESDMHGPRRHRKVVTVLCCIVGSTVVGESVDPEALEVRCFEPLTGIVEAHGGSVESFIGDAVMVVFGVPMAHEDDALRACRAAVELREALPELGISVRVGVNSGEVLTGTGERLVTGDAVTVAARLDQAAQAGEALISAATLRRVRAAVDVGEERRLTLNGKAEPVTAYPLLAAAGELQRPFATPMIGRARELHGLRDAFARTLADRSCQLFTVLGSAGVGKSRLAAEFLKTVEARVVRGRCLSYGEAIAYWPVVEILKQLEPLPEGDAAHPLRSLLGATDSPASTEEIAWGFRRLLEQEAQAEPLVCVLDDLNWGEETLLDLVEHVAGSLPVTRACTPSRTR
jgi:class 3 adenylate cyclase